MTDQTTAAPAGGEALPLAETLEIPAHRTESDGPLTAREAARSLTDWRRKREAAISRTVETPQAEAPKATPAPESETAQADDDAAPPQEAPGETQEAEPAAEAQPPIEPPRSWNADAKERWATLPRETQEYLASREQERDREVRKSQNEVAETRKTVDGERAKLEQARQQYESVLPGLLQTLQASLMGDFADIKTSQDAERLAYTDPARHQLWIEKQRQVAAVAQQHQAAQQRQQAERAAAWNEFASKQDALVYEKAPELTNKERAQKVSDRAVEVLKDLGFSDDDLRKAYNGEEALSIRDHRLQLLILDAVKYREAKASVSKPAAKPLPPVQRPGTAQSAQTGIDAQIRQLEKQIATTSGTNAQVRLGVKLMQLRREQAAGR